MQQLPPLDAVFLSMETRETPSQIGGLATLDPPTDAEFSYRRFVEFARERLSLCPRFAWRVQQVPLGLDRPYWVEDEAFDIRDQIHRVAVPAPGGARELSELVGLLFARPLDRARPLWEMFFIEGLQGGRVAMLWKVHHCLMDGTSGAGLAELLFDLQPVPAERPLVPVDDPARAGRPTSLGSMAARALRNGAWLPVAQGRHLGRFVETALDGMRERGLRGLFESGAAPSSVINQRVGSRRAVAWSSVGLDEVRTLKDDLGVKLNDVVLAITGGAVREYLAERGALPEESLRASVPMSLRSHGDTALGNQISDIPVTWGTHIEDPVERVLAIRDDTVGAKARAREGRGPDFMGLLAHAFLPGALRLLMAGLSRAGENLPLPSNAVVSNVPVTPVPVYVAGAKVVAMSPISLLAPSQGLNITVVSYCGELHFGITADPGQVEAPWALAGAIPKALMALQEALAAERALDGRRLETAFAPPR